MVYLPIVVSKYQPVICIFSPSVNVGIRMNEEKTDAEGGVMLEMLTFPRYGEMLGSGSCLKTGDSVGTGTCCSWVCGV